MKKKRQETPGFSVSVLKILTVHGSRYKSISEIIFDGGTRIETLYENVETYNRSSCRLHLALLQEHLHTKSRI